MWSVIPGVQDTREFRNLHNTHGHTVPLNYRVSSELSSGPSVNPFLMTIVHTYIGIIRQTYQTSCDMVQMGLHSPILARDPIQAHFRSFQGNNIPVRTPNRIKRVCPCMLPLPTPLATARPTGPGTNRHTAPVCPGPQNKPTLCSSIWRRDGSNAFVLR